MMARNFDLNYFEKQGLQAEYQRFTIKADEVNFFRQSQKCNIKNGFYRGTNVIGTHPGRFYGQKGKDSILVIGAHYDTVRKGLKTMDQSMGVWAYG